MPKASGVKEKLDSLFVKDAPRIPQGGRKALTAWAPIATLVLGVLSLLAAWDLWHWARMADSVISTVASFCGDRRYSPFDLSDCPAPMDTRFSVWLWLGVAFLVARGVLYLLAYSGLKDRKRAGWNYLYYALWLQIVYAVLSLFVPYDAGSHFISSLIGAAIGFYLLFQIRSSYPANRPGRQKPGPADHKAS
jgi:hypothetical protein